MKFCVLCGEHLQVSVSMSHVCIMNISVFLTFVCCVLDTVRACATFVDDLLEHSLSVVQCFLQELPVE
jgi:hypothetical protein